MKHGSPIHVLQNISRAENSLKKLQDLKAANYFCYNDGSIDMVKKCNDEMDSNIFSVKGKFLILVITT